MVVAVSRCSEHQFSKDVEDSIRLLTGLGVEGDAHLGVTVNNCQAGLLAAVLERDTAGNLIRKAGIMGVVLAGGEVRPGDAIKVALPPLPHQRLERV